MKGQLAQVKYLFEVTGLFPKTEETEAQPEGDSLAKTLLTHMGFPAVASETETTAKASGKSKSEPGGTKTVGPVPQREVAEVKGKNGGRDETADLS